MTHRQALDTMASERYLLGEMTERERHIFEEHYFSCEECAEDVRAGALMRDAARMAFADSPRASEPPAGAAVQPFRPRRPILTVSVVLPWTAAAAFALVAGYESLLVVPSLRQESGPHAVIPVTLRPSSRGEQPILQAGAGRAPVVLAVDINSAEAGELTYDLRGPDDRETVSGRAPAPQPGTPLYLFVPGRSLTMSGSYVLRIRSAGDGRELDEYRFSVAAR